MVLRHSSGSVPAHWGTINKQTLKTYIDSVTTKRASVYKRLYKYVPFLVQCVVVGSIEKRDVNACSIKVINLCADDANRQ